MPRTVFLTGSGKKILMMLAMGVVFFLIVFSGFFIMKTYSTFEKKTAPGVLFMDANVENLTREEVIVHVSRAADESAREALDAVIDHHHQTVIPEVSGLTIDVESTVDMLMNAQKHERVQPAYRLIPARVKWDDFPAYPAYSGNPAEQGVSFMINVAWGDEYLPAILEVLKKENVKATFFITGKWGEKNPDLLIKIMAEGHELGNHGYSDAEIMSELSAEKIKESLTKTNEIIYSTCGVEVLYFTPHKGDYSEIMLETVSRNNMRTVMWSLDTIDWSDPGLEVMENKVREKVQSGDIILMHPSRDIPELLASVIPYIKKKNLHILTIKDHLSPTPYF